MMILMLFLSFIILLAIGVPVAFSLGMSSFIYLVAANIPLSIMAQKMYSGIDSFVLLCIPGFILAGNLMNRGGITEKIVKFSNCLFGRISGGLALADIGASMIFAGISGTAAADASSIGGIMIPAMTKEGYDDDFSSALTASASTLGPIIPPSVPMIIAGTLTGISVSKLFAAGMMPGLLLAISLGIVAYYISVKRNYPKGEKASFSELVKSFFSAIWAILLVVLILIGILSGIFTPTEASIVAVVYSMVIGLFVYKELKIKDLPKILVETMITTASIMLLVGFANVFAWILTREQVPQLVANGMLRLTDNKYILLFLINILLLFVGTFMETVAALIILLPILLNVVVAVGVNPIHFAVIMVLNLVIGLTTPPVGVCLFICAAIGKVSIVKISKEILPFLGVSLVVLMIVTYMPQLILWPVNVFFK